MSRKLLGALVKSLYRANDKMGVACGTMWKIESPARLMFIADIGSYPRSRLFTDKRNENMYMIMFCKDQNELVNHLLLRCKVVTEI